MLGKDTNHFITGGMGEMLGFLDWRHFFLSDQYKIILFFSTSGKLIFFSTSHMQIVKQHRI